MRHLHPIRWLIIFILPTLLLTSCPSEIIQVGSYYAVFVRSTIWQSEPSQEDLIEIELLGSAGVVLRNNYYPLSRIPTINVEEIIDSPRVARPPIVRMNIFKSALDEPIFYLVFSPTHPAGLSASEVKEIEALLAKPAPTDWDDITAKIRELIYAQYPYAGILEPGDYVEVPNMFDW